VALRLRYLQQCEGAEARSVLVQDIPGARPPDLAARLAPQGSTESPLRHAAKVASSQALWLGALRGCMQLCLDVLGCEGGCVCTAVQPGTPDTLLLESGAQRQAHDDAQ
jgi:hypothetical protein